MEMLCTSTLPFLPEFVISLTSFCSFLENFEAIPFARGKTEVWSDSGNLPRVVPKVEMRVLGL